MNEQNSTDPIRIMTDYLNHPEKAQALFNERVSGAMRRRGIKELLVVPIRFDEDGEINIDEDPRFTPALHLANCKSTPRYEDGGFCMFRLKLDGDDVLFHGGEWVYWVSGDLDLSHLADESGEDPWLPISAFTNIQGLLTIADFLLSSEAAWQFTADNPESLYDGMVRAEFKRVNS